MAQQNALLNQILIDMGRSLLQYVGEAWPWITEDEKELQQQLQVLIQRQSEAAGRIAQLLSQRDWPIDFGVYPVEYTDLHYVALDFLLGQLVQNADELTEEIIAALKICEEEDPEAAEVLDSVFRDQQFIANRLREMTETHLRQKQPEPAAE